MSTYLMDALEDPRRSSSSECKELLILGWSPILSLRRLSISLCWFWSVGCLQHNKPHMTILQCSENRMQYAKHFHTVLPYLRKRTSARRQCDYQSSSLWTSWKTDQGMTTYALSKTEQWILGLYLNWQTASCAYAWNIGTATRVISIKRSN